MKSLKIGRLKIESPLILAPMVDITNLPYRLVCRKAGCSLAFTEMINVPAIIHENEKTKKMMLTRKEDSPLGIQITGNNLKDFEKVLPYLKDYNLVDLNCGCPSERITDNDSGSCLLNTPDKIAKIIKILKKSGIPVTAKIRLGFKKNNSLEIAKVIEKAGADAITVHPRLAKEGYDVPADWKEIAKIKKALKIPVIGNGDVLNPEKAKEMLEQTGCDAVMIARGAIGDPLIFERTLDYLKTGELKQPDFKKNIKSFNEYLKLSEKYGFDDIAIIKHLGTKFIKGIQNAGKMRNELMQFKSFNEIKNFFAKLTA